MTKKRRPQFAQLRLFVPTITWAEPGLPRRPLVYDSDVLAHLNWAALNVETLAREWAPNAQGAWGEHLAIDLSILNRDHSFADADIDRDLELLALEMPDQQFGEGGIVLDQQQAGAGHDPTPSPG